MTVFAFVLKSAIFGVLLYLWIKEIPLKWLLWVQLWIRLNIGLQMVDQSVIQNWHLWCKCYPHRPKSEGGRDNHHSNSSQDWSRIHRAHSSIGYTCGSEFVLDPRKKEVFWNSFNRHIFQVLRTGGTSISGILPKLGPMRLFWELLRCEIYFVSGPSHMGVVPHPM